MEKTTSFGWSASTFHDKPPRPDSSAESHLFLWHLIGHIVSDCFAQPFHCFSYCTQHFNVHRQGSLIVLISSRQSLNIISKSTLHPSFSPSHILLTLQILHLPGISSPWTETEDDAENPTLLHKAMPGYIRGKQTPSGQHRTSASSNQSRDPPPSGEQLNFFDLNARNQANAPRYQSPVNTASLPQARNQNVNLDFFDLNALKQSQVSPYQSSGNAQQHQDPNHALLPENPGFTSAYQTQDYNPFAYQAQDYNPLVYQSHDPSTYQPPSQYTSTGPNRTHSCKCPSCSV